mgnify:CR=1 FL=1
MGYLQNINNNYNLHVQTISLKKEIKTTIIRCIQLSHKITENILDWVAS